MTRNASLLDRLTAASTKASRDAARALYGAIPGKQLMFEPLRGKLPKKVFQHLYFQGTISIPLGSRSFSMRHYGYSIENALFWGGVDTGWEPSSLAVWRTLAPSARGVLDIGANTGLFALVAQALNPQASVVAVEPVARIFEKLAANAALNAMNIVCICEGVSDGVGLGSFVDPGTDHFYSITISRGDAPPEDGGGSRRTVALTSIDALVERLVLSHVDLIKLDVESHEPAALRGASQTLSRHRPTLLIEIWNDNVGRAVDDILRPVGYLGYRIDERERRVTLAPVTRTSGTANFLFVPSEQRAAIESRLRNESPLPLSISG